MQNLLNMHRDLHPHSSVDRLQIPRAQGGRGLLTVKDCVEMERSNLFDYTVNNNERFLVATTEEIQLRTKIDGKNKEECENERQAVWKEKASQFLVLVLSQLETNTERDTTNLEKNYTGSCANLRLNVKTNGSCINQSQCWKMTHIK